MNQHFNRIIRKNTIILNAKREEVFPLLCPVREKEWLPGFSSEIIFSASEISELDGVFLTHKNETDEAVWIIPVYDKNNFIELIYFQPKMKVVVIKLNLTDLPDNKTSLAVEYTYTSLSEEGNEQIYAITDDLFKKQINIWQVCLNYLFKSGTRIPEEMILGHH